MIAFIPCEHGQHPDFCTRCVSLAVREGIHRWAKMMQKFHPELFGDHGKQFYAGDELAASILSFAEGRDLDNSQEKDIPTPRYDAVRKHQNDILNNTSPAKKPCNCGATDDSPIHETWCHTNDGESNKTS